MTQTLAMVGKIGPAFGDGRASFVEVEFSTYHDYDGQTYTERVANWADGDRADALAGVMERSHDTATRDGDFGGAEYVGGCWPAAEYDAAVDLMADFLAEREQKAGETLASARRRMLAALDGCVLRVGVRDGRVTFREVDFPVNGQLFTVAGCRWCQEGQTHSHE